MSEHLPTTLCRNPNEDGILMDTCSENMKTYFEHIILHMACNYCGVYSWELLNCRLIEANVTSMIIIVGIQELIMQIDQAFDKTFFY
jgi:hypothetical protein